jgi:hypothetical protein
MGAPAKHGRGWAKVAMKQTEPVIPAVAITKIG